MVIMVGIKRTKQRLFVENVANQMILKRNCNVHKKQANMVACDDFTAMTSETNMIEDDVEWWIDSGATKHIARNKYMFKVYKLVKDQDLFIRNSSTAKVIGKGKVVLHLSPRMALILNEILHVPNIRKNLVLLVC